jgi:hypothetical protein
MRLVKYSFVSRMIPLIPPPGDCPPDLMGQLRKLGIGISSLLEVEIAPS